MKKKLGVLLMAMSLVMAACGGNVEDEGGSNDRETVAYAFGTYTDTGYENPSLGYRFTAPEGCLVADEKEILQLAGITMDIMAEDLSEQMVEYAKQANIFDLYAYYPETNTNVNIVVQQLDTTEITMDYLLDNSRKQLESLTYMDVTVETGSEVVVIAGKEFSSMKAVTVANGVTMKQTYYALIEEGRIINITITCLLGNEAEAETLLAAFSEI